VENTHIKYSKKIEENLQKANNNLADLLCIAKDIISTPRAFKILYTLDKYKALTCSDLKKILGFSDGSIRNHIRRMIKLGLCEYAKGFDSRKKYIKLTEHGKEILKECKKALITMIEEKYGKYTATEYTLSKEAEKELEIYVNKPKEFLKEHGYESDFYGYTKAKPRR